VSVIIYSICPSICLSVCLSVPLSVYPTIRPFFHLIIFCVSLPLSVYLPTYLPINLPTYQPTYMSISLCICLPAYICICSMYVLYMYITINFYVSICVSLCLYVCLLCQLSLCRYTPMRPRVSHFSGFWNFFFRHLLWRLGRGIELLSIHWSNTHGRKLHGPGGRSSEPYLPAMCYVCQPRACMFGLWTLTNGFIGCREKRCEYYVVRNSFIS
jgi:hypothetical protein